jgi:protein arginine N-methyltransferase 5
VLPTGVFLTNKKGYPVLSARHQAALKALVARHGAQVMVSGPPAGGEARGLKPYQQCVDRLQLSGPLADDALRAPPFSSLRYVDHLYRQLPDPTDEQRFERPYLDYLQAPLQPLMDNLESQTYETRARARPRP